MTNNTRQYWDCACHSHQIMSQSGEGSDNFQWFLADIGQEEGYIQYFLENIECSEGDEEGYDDMPDLIENSDNEGGDEEHYGRG